MSSPINARSLARHKKGAHKKSGDTGWSLLKGLGVAWTGLLFACAMTLTQNSHAAITVKSSGDDGHVAANTLDGSLAAESRWSAYGDGQWIQYDLGGKSLVKSVNIAFYQGDARTAYFDILVSNDAKQWKTVFTGQSSGDTALFQKFDFSDVEARYVRLLHHGNSANRWNSLLEVRIYHATLTPVPPVAKSVYSENFDALATGTLWKGNKRLKVEAACGVNNSKCLRVTYVPTSDGSERLTVGQTIPAALEYTLNYDVLFENDFEWVKGGKLPGLAPTNYTTGCKDPNPNGWSVRMMWRRLGEPVLYIYDQNRANRCGEDAHSGVQFAKNTWQPLSVHVRVNQPASASNAEMSLYLAGKRIAHVANAQLRGAEGSATLINQFIFHTFFGGSDDTWSPSKNVHARFDNIAVYPGLRVRNSVGM